MSTDSPNDMSAPTTSDDPAHGTSEAQNEPTTPGMSPAGSAPHPAEGIPPGRVGESPTPAPQTGQAHRQSNRFTERASQALRLAQEEAVRSKLHYIGTEHLLLGLLRVSEGIAARVLESQGVTLVAARAATRVTLAATRAPRTGGLGVAFRALRRLFGGPSAPPETASEGQKPNGEG